MSLDGPETASPAPTSRVFWSWQSDESPANCRTFIRGALVDAIAAVNEELSVDDADRPEIDHDTRGTAGMADIPATILSKIASSAVFVADVTPIAQSASGKWLPNPNVMIELGWAMKSPGWERVICVLNTAGGATIEDLPFDIRQRRIITYSLADGDAEGRKRSTRKQLVKDFKGALDTNLGQHLDEVAASRPVRRIEARKDNPSVWASAGTSLVHNDAFGQAGRDELRRPDGPRSYMRVTPQSWEKGTPNITDVKELKPSVNAPSDGCSSGSYGANADGFVRYWITGYGEDKSPETENVTQYFEETGEFWMLHGTAIAPHRGKVFLRDKMMLAVWSAMLRQSLAAMDQLGAGRLRVVEVGLWGMEEVRWHSEWESEQTRSRKNSVMHQRQHHDWSPSAQITFLTDAYNRVLDLFGFHRQSEADVTTFLMRFDHERFPREDD